MEHYSLINDLGNLESRLLTLEHQINLLEQTSGIEKVCFYFYFIFLF
jgi:hypothetical protein